MYSETIQLSFDTNLAGKRRTTRTFKTIFLSVFKLFREKVASLLNIYVQYTQHSSDPLAHNSVRDISAVVVYRWAQYKAQYTNKVCTVSRWFILIFICFSQLFWAPCTYARVKVVPVSCKHPLNPWSVNTLQLQYTKRRHAESKI